MIIVQVSSIPRYSYRYSHVFSYDFITHMVSSWYHEDGTFCAQVVLFLAEEAETVQKAIDQLF